MLYFIKKIAYREGGFIILEEEGFINQQARLYQGTFDEISSSFAIKSGIIELRL